MVGRACPLVETATPHLGRQSLKRSNTVLGRGVGREQVVDPVVGERIDNEEMRGRRVALRGGVLDLLGGIRDLDQRRCQRVRPSEMRAPRSSAAYSRVRLIAI